MWLEPHWESEAMCVIGRIMGWFTDPGELLRGVVFVLPGILIGLTVHEWAHAFAAYKCGDPTAKNLGRMTLNPFAHLEPIGLLALLLVGFGWAKPVPVSSRNFKHFKRDDMIVSLAGITMNFLTALAFILLTYLLMALIPSLRASFNYRFIMTEIVIINLSLMIFNLIPIYPLDGSHVLENLLMPHAPKFCLFLRNYGRYIMLACLVFGLFSYILSPLVNWFYGWMDALGQRLFLLIAGI